MARAGGGFPDAGGGFPRAGDCFCRAPWWLPEGHTQTIVPACWISIPRIPYRRERWPTPDDDFLDIDFADEGADAADAPVLVLFHGLEGGSSSHYARVLMDGCRRRGWRGIVVHFRGCGGDDNRLLRAYHSGDSAEIAWVLDRVAGTWPAAPRFAVGVSLGGNALAKWCGEQGAAAAAVVRACAAISAPFDLAAGGAALEIGFNRIYTRMFLRTLIPKALHKARRFPGVVDARRIRSCRSIREFDDAFTAPVHGFLGVDDYWRRSSAKPGLGRVAVPFLALNAVNDPFVPAASLPSRSEVASCVVLDQPAQGGHVGFYAVAPDPWYLRARTMAFLQAAR